MYSCLGNEACADAMLDTQCKHFFHLYKVGLLSTLGCSMMAGSGCR